MFYEHQPYEAECATLIRYNYYIVLTIQCVY